MGSIKINIMVTHVNAKWPNESYRTLSPYTVRDYLKKKFKASTYMADEAVKILYKNE